MRLQSGRYYFTRDGRMVGPLTFDGLQWVCNRSMRRWHHDGRFLLCIETVDDIIEEVYGLGRLKA